MKQANSKLSECTSELSRELKAAAFAAEEINLFHAPSECMGVVYNASAKKCAAIISKYYENEIDYWKELDSRVSSKWIYFSGIEQAQSEVVGDQLWREQQG